MPKQHKKAVEDAVNLVGNLRDSWTSTYAIFKDYRRMAEGELPQAMANTYDTDEYKRKSKLRPRLIVDAIKDLQAYATHTLFHRGDPFEFIPFEKNDVDGAERANDLVRYSWWRTKVEPVAKQILRDTEAIGSGFGMIQQFTDRRELTQLNEGEDRDKNRYIRKRKEVYRGGKLFRIRPETLYPEKVRQWDKVSAIARIMTVPVSVLRKESGENGLYGEYKGNIRKLKPLEFTDPEEKYDTTSEHTSDTDYKVKDFPVLVTELWQRMRYGKDDYPTWYCITIADYESQQPLLIRFARNPMGNDNHPFIMCRIFPHDDRLYGYSVVEMLKDLNLEMFHKRNQRIDFVNLLNAVHGTLIAKRGQIGRDNLIFKQGRVITLKTGEPKDLNPIVLDASIIGATVQEESIIEKDVAQTMAQNKITSGRDPSRREAATTNAIIDENAKMRQTDPIANIEDTLIKPVAMGYLEQAQIFMPRSMRIRILGEQGYEWQDIKRDDVLGYYDIICKASTEIIPRSLKQANFNAFIQTYANMPNLNLDWAEIFKYQAELNEFPNAHKWIKDLSQIQAEIEREENFMLATGQPWQALRHENHIEHLNSHTDLMLQQEDGSDIFIALQMHIQEHLKYLSIQQGQQQVGGQPMAGNMGEFLDNTNAAIAPKSQGR